MAIKLNLDRVMLERRISLTDLAEKVGITLANLSILKTNKARAIRFTTLDALCRELQCQPGELLEFVAQDAREEVQPEQVSSAPEGRS
ncbi:MAG TPA: helix-turn-helix transcriptional regulator [Rhizomicrobium sp.]|jgi:putative transcriptional regulator|nr:helix-turn-helix transcriptional regulator [Rhizomicrobium sp.]